MPKYKITDKIIIEWFANTKEVLSITDWFMLSATACRWRGYANSYELQPHRIWIDKCIEIDKGYTAIEDFNKGREFLNSELANNVFPDLANRIKKANPIFLNEPEYHDLTHHLSDAFELTPVETFMLDIAITTTFSTRNHGYDPWDGFITKLGLDVYSKASKFPKSDFENFSNSFLVKIGILIKHKESHSYYLNSTFRELALEYDSKENNIREILFPNKIKTDLTVENYSHLSTEIERTEKIISKSLERRDRGVNVLLWGDAGTGKTELALAMCKKNNWDLIVVGDISDADDSEKGRSSRLANLKLALSLFREQKNAVILFDEMEDLVKLDIDAKFSKAFINRIIETCNVPIIWTTNDIECMGQPVLRRMIYNIEFKIPDAKARHGIWKKYLDDHKVEIDDATIQEFAEDFPIAPALINNAVKITTMSSLAKEDIPVVIKSMDKLVNYGYERPSPPKHNMDNYDLTCVNTDIDLIKLTNQLSNIDRGFSLCLYGPAGTGKSEYGRYLSGKLRKKVLFKRASDIFDMYLGQSERNIAKAFKQSKEENKVLLIDEGDSFLRDRQKAERGWEVAVVNEMLSQMELHTEPFILTTNLMEGLDPASLRRFTFKLKFDFMTKDQARRLFKGYFNVDAPPAIDREDMLTPGDFANVKNKATILGITDAQALYDMLHEECAMKPGHSNRIGF